MSAVAESRIRRSKMTTANQMKASQWIFKNATLIQNMTLDEITAAINGQAGVTSPLVIKNTRTLLEAADLTWKPGTQAESRVARQAMYDKMLTLQGRIEVLEEQNVELNKRLRIAEHQLIAYNPE
jgi:hypothetical protein